MGSKITIDGKDYTERIVESLEINGEIYETNVIEASAFGDNYTIEVNINTGEEIRGFYNEVESQVQAMEKIDNDGDKELYRENKEPVQNTEQISLLNRFIKFIKNIFNNKS